jgi:hypothetical protein
MMAPAPRVVIAARRGGGNVEINIGHHAGDDRFGVQSCRDVADRPGGLMDVKDDSSGLQHRRPAPDHVDAGTAQGARDRRANTLSRSGHQDG